MEVLDAVLPEQYLTPKEVIEHWNLGPHHVYSAMAKGLISTVKVGRNYRIRMSSLREWEYLQRWVEVNPDLPALDKPFARVVA